MSPHLSYVVDSSFIMPLLSEAGIVDATELVASEYEVTRYDVSARRLRRAGITLCCEEHPEIAAAWSVSLPQVWAPGSPLRRIALDSEEPGEESGVPVEARRLLAAFVLSDPLDSAERYRGLSRRWLLAARPGSGLAELTDERLDPMRQGPEARGLRTILVADKGLEEGIVGALDDAFQRAGARTRASSGDDGGRPVNQDIFSKLKAGGGDPAGVGVQAALTRSVRRLVMNDPGVRLGEMEGVHQMRVAARRLSSDLRTFAPLVDNNWARGLIDGLRTVARALGEVRDMDVLLENMKASAGEIEEDLSPLFDSLMDRRSACRSDLGALLDSPAYVDLIERLSAAAVRPMLTEAAAGPCRVVLPPLVQAAWSKLQRKASTLVPDSDDADFHRVRIEAKKVRYAAEAVGRCLDKKEGHEAASFAAAVAGVQSALGDLQDATLAQEAVAAEAERHPQEPGFALAAGRLLERQRATARKARAAHFESWDSLEQSAPVEWMSA